jgi:hypothetical protein
MAHMDRGRYQPAGRKLRMSDSEELASKERRRRLVERLNQKEKLLHPASPWRMLGQL